MDPNAVMFEAAKSANVDGRDGNRRAPPNLTPKTRWICIYRYIIRQSAFRYVYSLAQLGVVWLGDTYAQKTNTHHLRPN